MTDKTTKALLMAIVVLLALNLYTASGGGLIQQAHAQSISPVRCIIDRPIEVKRISEPVTVRNDKSSSLTVAFEQEVLTCGAGGMGACALRTVEMKR
ncbi:hypothetical protein ATI61_110192 [Archangium gephyra]|uniref:Uncharacterized protein n=1 Tax=Archangium gephyra TaxID=48 RepID=A0ABX9JUA3_9BACT|nr:hypothetical protein [Archangium gephyra]REG27185.1 hypothetical protein ATI61_110192 [Archangium gephyra]